MLDLRVLRDLWTEDGARAVFAQLLTHCVRSIWSQAQSVRPDPGDDGVDTFVGDFDGDLHVWQAKYFCDGVGASQQKQIRESWRRCIESPRFSRVVKWTLCIPIELSTTEHAWWQRWSKNEAQKHDCQIELWCKTDFERFRARRDLAPLFDIALRASDSPLSVADVIASMRSQLPARPLVPLPRPDHHRDALFVRKLELAGVVQHRAARTAFYNFELLRMTIEQGGTPSEQAELVDLRERILQLWEDAFNGHSPGRLGGPLVSEVGRRIASEDNRSLTSPLPAKAMHKLGAVHDWADHCQAGWTEGFEEVAREDE